MSAIKLFRESFFGYNWAFIVTLLVTICGIIGIWTFFDTIIPTEERLEIPGFRVYALLSLLLYVNVTALGLKCLGRVTNVITRLEKVSRSGYLFRLTYIALIFLAMIVYCGFIQETQLLILATIVQFLPSLIVITLQYFLIKDRF